MKKIVSKLVSKSMGSPAVSSGGGGGVVVLVLLILVAGVFVLSRDPRAVVSAIQPVPVAEVPAVPQAPEERDSFFLESSDTPGYARFYDKLYGFKIDYPEGWDLKTPNFELVAAMFFAPQDEEGGSFYTNVNVTVDKASRYGDFSLQDYADQALKQLSGIFPEYALLDQGSISLGQYDGHFLRASYSDGGKSLEFYSIFALAGDQIFALTYSYLPDERDATVSVIQHMAESFVVLE